MSKNGVAKENKISTPKQKNSITEKIDMLMERHSSKGKYIPLQSQIGEFPLSIILKNASAFDRSAKRSQAQIFKNQYTKPTQKVQSFFTKETDKKTEKPPKIVPEAKYSLGNFPCTKIQFSGYDKMQKKSPHCWKGLSKSDIEIRGLKWACSWCNSSVKLDIDGLSKKKVLDQKGASLSDEFKGKVICESDILGRKRTWRQANSTGEVVVDTIKEPRILSVSLKTTSNELSEDTEFFDRKYAIKTLVAFFHIEESMAENIVGEKDSVNIAELVRKVDGILEASSTNKSLLN